MALHTGVSGGGAVVKRAAATNAAARRRARGTLVRCRAYIWTKDELARLNALADQPHDVRHELNDLDGIEPKLSALFCGHLKRVAKSDGNLVMSAQMVDDEKDAPMPLSPPQPPVQKPLPQVAGIATRLIDLSL